MERHLAMETMGRCSKAGCAGSQHTGLLYLSRLCALAVMMKDKESGGCRCWEALIYGSWLVYLAHCLLREGFWFFCLYACFVVVCLFVCYECEYFQECTPCVCLVPGGLKRASSDLLALGLQVVVSLPCRCWEMN